MKGKGPFMAKPSLVNSEAWNTPSKDGGGNLRYPAREIWVPKRGGGKNGSGPSGWKMRPSKVLARALAERKHGK